MDIRKFKIHADEEGYRFSCRVPDCSEPCSTHWLNREDAVEAGKAHHEALHVERDKDLEAWIEYLGKEANEPSGSNG